MNSVASEEKKPPEVVVLGNEQDLVPPSLEVIRSELLKISQALNSPETPRDKWGQFYAAQQAISWAAGGFAGAPYAVIEGGKVQPPMDTDTH